MAGQEMIEAGTKFLLFAHHKALMDRSATDAIPHEAKHAAIVRRRYTGPAEERAPCTVVHGCLWKDLLRREIRSRPPTIAMASP